MENILVIGIDRRLRQRKDDADHPACGAVPGRGDGDPA